jgi:hypothetical protein
MGADERGVGGHRWFDAAGTDFAWNPTIDRMRAHAERPS